MTQESRLSQEADASDVTPLDDVTSFGESPLTPLTMTALDASPALAKDDGDDVTTRDCFRLTSEAFEFQRAGRDDMTAEDLLSHLFVGSLQSK